MQHPGRDHLDTPMPVPTAGRSTRLRLGNAELVLERVRGGLTLLAHDGTAARRFTLGVGRGELHLRLLPPAHPVLVTPRDGIALPPGGRLRGYVLVPLVPTLIFLGNGREGRLLELPPAELTTEWDEALGAAQRCSSPFLHRLVPGGGTVCAVVPVVLHNRSREVQRPAHLVVHLQPVELRELRGRILAAPRRLVLTGGGDAATLVRAFPRQDLGWRAAAEAGR